MKKKIVALILIVCLVGPPLFAEDKDKGDEIVTAIVDALLSGEPLLIAGGVGLLILAATIITPSSKEANAPSDRAYRASDDGTANPKEKKDSIFNHVRPVFDFRYTPTGNTQTIIGVQLSF